MFTLPTGVRQKVLHSRGTKEVSFSVSGDLSVEGKDIVGFLQPEYRGLIFPVKVIQGPEISCEQISDCMMESFQLNGSAGGTIKYSISGKGLSDVESGDGWEVTAHKYAQPGWSSGNELVKSWSITHSISLSAQWHNNQNVLPSYYRPQESEYQMKITTMVELREYDTISIGIGTFAIITGLVTSRSISYSGKEAKTYDVEITNVNVGNSALTEGATAEADVNAPANWI